MSQFSLAEVCLQPFYGNFIIDSSNEKPCIYEATCDEKSQVNESYVWLRNGGLIILDTGVNFEVEYFLNEETEGVLTDTVIYSSDQHVTWLPQLKPNAKVVSPFKRGSPSHSVEQSVTPTESIIM